MKTSMISVLTRRDVMATCALALARGDVLCLAAQGENRVDRAGRLSFILSKELKGTFYRAISPDSRLLCVASMASPSGKISVAGGNGAVVGYQPPSAFTLSVLEMGSWRSIYSASPGGGAGAFGFFLSSDTLYGETSVYSHADGRISAIKHFMVINLGTGSIEEREQRVGERAYAGCQALKDSTLICTADNNDLLQVEWPSFQERVRVSGVGSVRSARFTGDRKTLVHLVGQRLFCRRTDDFSVLWTRDVDDNIDLSARMKWSDPAKAPYLSSAQYAVSADGTVVVLGVTGTSFEGGQKRFYTEVLDGRNGKPTARWPLDHGDDLVVSPDGALVGIAMISDRQSGWIETTVRMFGVSSGRQVAEVIHDRLPRNRRLNASLLGGVDFTPDGRYLITSANGSVKIWQLSR